MGDTHEFRVTVGTSEEIDEEEAAALLRWAVEGAAYDHEHLNYITVQYSEMDEEEQERMLQMLNKFNDSDIEAAADAIDRLVGEDEDSPE